MPKIKPEDKAEKKNQKNIYVHKINSLIKSSKDQLLDGSAFHLDHKKKIKKTHSEIDKNAQKLEKNRESAKRARLRKKLYIKLLESQVEKLRDISKEGEKLEKESSIYLKNLQKKEDKLKRVELDEVEKYLSRQNMNETKNNKDKESLAMGRMDKLIEEVCQMIMCSCIRNIRSISSQVKIEQMLLPSTFTTSEAQLKQVSTIIAKLLEQTEEIRKYILLKENEKVKKMIQDAQALQKESQILEEEEGFFNENKGVVLGQNMENRDSIHIYNFCCPYLRKENCEENVYVNVNEVEKILIKSLMFVEANEKQF